MLIGKMRRKNVTYCATCCIWNKAMMDVLKGLIKSLHSWLSISRVLQQGAWPLSQNNLSPLNIPVELEKTVSMYEKFYAKQFNGRKLTWLHHLSNGDIKLGYLSKTYIINMTTFQVRIYNIDFGAKFQTFFFRCPSCFYSRNPIHWASMSWKMLPKSPTTNFQDTSRVF